jgi:type II secretory pathway pseudopilin PulG
MKRTAGFTVVEIMVAIVLVGAAATLLLFQKANFEGLRRDQDRKTAINAMYYNLEEVFYEKNKSYPAKIDSKVLRAMDPGLFTDPMGKKMNEEGAEYRYEGLDCTNDACKGYKLSSTMEKEAEYVKNNRNK